MSFIIKGALVTKNRKNATFTFQQQNHQLVTKTIESGWMIGTYSGYENVCFAARSRNCHSESMLHVE